MRFRLSSRSSRPWWETLSRRLAPSSRVRSCFARCEPTRKRVGVIIALADGRLAKADTQIARAQRLIDRANQASTQGQRLRSTVDSAGFVLRAHVSKIVDEVSVQVHRTEPSLEAITGVTAGLGNLTAQFSPLPGVPGPTEGTSDVGGTLQGFQELQSAANDLEKSFSALQRATRELLPPLRQVAAFIERSTGLDSVLTGLDLCKVHELDHFKVIPDLTQVQVAQGARRLFTVTGASGIPQAQIVGTALVGVEVDVTLERGSYVVALAVSKKGETGETAIAITGGNAGNAKVINVTVIEKTPTAKSDVANGGTARTRAVKPAEAVLNDDRNDLERNFVDGDLIAKIQKKLDVPITRVLDTATRNAIKKIEEEKRFPKDGHVDEAIINFLRLN